MWRRTWKGLSSVYAFAIAIIFARWRRRSEMTVSPIRGQFFFLHMWIRPTVGQPGNSSIISRVKLRQTTVQLGKRAELGLTTGAVHRSVSLRRQVFRRVFPSTTSTQPGHPYVNRRNEYQRKLGSDANSPIFLAPQHKLVSGYGLRKQALSPSRVYRRLISQYCSNSLSVYCTLYIRLH